MCLIVFAWQSHPRYDLIVAANRDEFHARPSTPADWWEDCPQVLAGRDLQAGGTWLGITRDGRFATVTNYREQSFTRGSYRSRGALVSDYLLGAERPAQFSGRVDGDDYAGFNLLTADSISMSYVSNRGDILGDIPPGIYGLSNASLDTPWSKLLRSKARLAAMISDDAIDETNLFEMLGDRETAVEDVNSEHLTREQARAITAPFIVNGEYGTRSSTVLLRTPHGAAQFTERRFDPHGNHSGTSQYSLDAN